MSGETLAANDFAGQQLSGAAGDDVLYAGHNSVVLTGNAGADDFVFQYLPWNAGQVTDFAVGTDRLDLSSLLKASGYAGSDPIADGYVILQADGSGGTEVLYDTDGPASGNTIQYRITDLQHVSQTGLTWAQLTTGSSGSSGGGGPGGGGGGPGGVTLTGGDSPQTLTGGVGDDTITAGHSSDTITTEAGHDLVVFKYAPWNASTVTDFTVGEDKADFSQLLAGVNYSGSDPVRDGYLSLVADGGDNTKVMLDKDATGATLQIPITVTDLHGVDPHTVTYAQLTGPASVATTLAFTSGGDQASVAPSEVKPFPFTVTRSGSTDGTTTAHWSVATNPQDGSLQADTSDFQGGAFPSGDLTFAPGETSKSIVVNVVGEANHEPDEYFYVQLSNITGGTTGSPPGEGIISNPGSSGGGGSAGVVLTSSKPGDTLVGGPGDDTLNAGQGPDTLTGNAGADHFVFPNLPWHSGEVTDFAPGTDKVDLSALVSASHYAGTNAIADGYLSLRADGQGDTLVYWDSDGPSGAQYPTFITTVDHVAPSSLGSGDFLFH